MSNSPAPSSQWRPQVENRPDPSKISRLRGEIAQFGNVGDVDLSRIPILSDLNPGFKPTEYNVLVALAPPPEMKGKVFLPDEVADMMGMGAQVGRMVAASPIAFNYDNGWPAEGGPPEVGDIVWFARYAGGEFSGLDGRTYRLVKDRDIGGTITGGTNG